MDRTNSTAGPTPFRPELHFVTNYVSANANANGDTTAQLRKTEN